MHTLQLPHAALTQHQVFLGQRKENCPWKSTSWRPIRLPMPRTPSKMWSLLFVPAGLPFRLPLNRTLISLQLLIAIFLAASIVGLATFYRYGELPLQALLRACLIVLFGCLPPVWISGLFKQGLALPLFATVWRFSSLLPGILILRKTEGLERNCFMYAMLACYLTGLSLESWLFIRETKLSGGSDDPFERLS